MAKPDGAKKIRQYPEKNYTGIEKQSILNKFPEKLDISPIIDLKKGLRSEIKGAMSDNFQARSKDIEEVSALTSPSGKPFNRPNNEKSDSELVREVAKNLLKAERPERPPIPKKEDYSTQEEYMSALEQYAEASKDYDEKMMEYESKLEEAILSLSEALNSMASSELKSIFRQQQFESMLKEADVELQDYKIDEMSGLLSQNAFQKNIDNIYKYFYKRDIPIVCIYLDLDFLKQLNDAYGHAVGDLAIKKMGEVLNRNVRPSDLAARIGGEEFNVILTNATLEEGKIVAERIREEISKELIPYRPDPKSDFVEYINISASIGVAASNYNKDLDENEKMSFKTFQSRADNALYRSKEKEGRNAVSVSNINEDGTQSTDLVSPDDRIKPKGYKKDKGQTEDRSGDENIIKSA